MASNVTNTVTGKLALIQLGLTTPQEVSDMAWCRRVIDTFDSAVRNERYVRGLFTAGTATQAQLDDAVNAVTLNLSLMDGGNGS